MILFFIRLVLNALLLMLVAYLVPGIHVDTFVVGLIAAIIIALVNALVRPLIELLALPVTILTLGLFTLVINAAMFGLAAWLTPGFTVAGFGAAFWGALVYSILSWALSVLIGKK